MAPANHASDQAYRERLHRWAQLPLPRLQPGEQLYGVADVGLDRYVRRGLPRRHRTAVRPPQAPAARRRGCLPAVLLLPLQLLDLEGFVEAVGESTVRGLRRAFHGRPFSGGWGSRAGRFVIAVRTGPSTHRRFRHGRTLLAVTDRRVLLVDHDHGELMASFPRPELARTGTVRSRQPERVDLVFADGSHIAVVARSHAYAQGVRALVDGYGPH
ncbi:hypothetical protein [Kitasatospora sp. DSM 101779]|uniref:hypothetical protein n=1 Tax=Kitasatospora sp. DSM 101779 TaxID=2853165 RepID=UPI0021D89CBB|nr:hypothetical protein [Kitasatospora sp. DSM 101779]MCU7826140.1 hypothetical protein [Kitasatospora sp. DSM 101779]